jgi:hypothetical protein
MEIFPDTLLEVVAEAICLREKEYTVNVISKLP